MQWHIKSVAGLRQPPRTTGAMSAACSTPLAVSRSAPDFYRRHISLAAQPAAACAVASPAQAASSARLTPHLAPRPNTRGPQRLPPVHVAVPRPGNGGTGDGEPEPGGAAAAAANPGGVLAQGLQRVLALGQVFSDPKYNSKVLALAVGQMLCSVATLIHDSYLPIYVHDELGLSTTEIGAVQGAAQFLCQLSKGVSGVVGDLLGSQVRVLVFGTFLTFLCKPMFAMLSGVYGAMGLTACLYWFFAAKLLDRLSKGIREAPTKAVINELAKEAGESPDAAYGLRQSLATAGMLVGSTVASLAFYVTGQNFILTFALASIPPGMALMWLAQNFQEELFGKPTEEERADAHKRPAATSIMSVDVTGVKPVAAAANDATADVAAAAAFANGSSSGVVNGINGGLASAASAGSTDTEPVQLNALQRAWAVLTAFKPAYWQALAVVAVLYFARFDASFLSLRAKAVMPKQALPMLTLLNSLLQVVLSAPLAKVSSTGVKARNRLLLVGFGVMVAANACFALPMMASPTGMFIGVALLGTHMAMTHAITISMVSSYMPTGVLPGVGKLSGTAVSFTDLLLGFVLAASNTLAGVLSDMSRTAGLGNVGCFAGGATACVSAAVLLVLFDRFGDLGKDELVVAKKGKKAKAT